MSKKMLLAGAVCGLMGLASVSNAAVIMDANTHNGHMLYANDAYLGGGADGYSDVGFWDVNNPPVAGRVVVPTGWNFTGWYSVYYMGIGDIQLRAGLGGNDALVWNNTGELAQPNTVYTVSANLGGLTGSQPTAYVLATENADGTGNVIELAKVARNGDSADGYTMTNLSASGPATTAAVSGYYIQVLLNTEYNVNAPIGDQNESTNGYIGHITVTSEVAVPEPMSLGALAVGGAMMVARRRRV